LAQGPLIVFSLGPRSKQRLRGVHPDLVKVVERAIEISTIDFTVLEGLRTPERQKALVEAGASQTLNSRHLTGHAVDLGAWVGDEVRWDWPLYHKIAAAMKEAARQLGVAIVWGGDWRTFKDGPHFELDRKAYP
jgi:peptidoglycan L-alanyl-D-glutamate endopeptidase CwlK